MIRLGRILYQGFFILFTDVISKFTSVKCDDTNYTAIRNSGCTVYVDHDAK